MMKIRRVEEGDLVPCILGIQELWNEGRYGALGFDLSHTLRSVRSLLFSEQGMGVVAWDGERLAGGMLGMLDTYFCVPQRFAVELGLFLYPEYRGRGRTALKIIHAFVQQAKERGAKEVRASATNWIDDRRVERLYAAAGFEHTGPTFRRIL